MESDLIARLESAREGQERELLELVFDLCVPAVPMASEGGDVSAYNAWVEIANDFDAMLDAHAWTSAAEMLVPEGCNYGCGTDTEFPRGWAWTSGHRTEFQIERAPFPWAALAAANAKARTV